MKWAFLALATLDGPQYCRGVDRGRLHLLVVVTGIVLVTAAWCVVYVVSVPLALAMSVLALAMGPVTAILVPPSGGSSRPFETWDEATGARDANRDTNKE